MGMKPLLSTLPPDSRPWFTNEMQNVLLSVKMTLDHWATVHLFSSLAQVRCFWRCFCFRSLQLLSTPCEALPSVWTGFAWQYSSSLLLVHLFLPIFFFPVNFAFIMLWYSVHSVNSHTFQEWPSVTFPLCGGCQWLSCGPLPSQHSSPLLWFQRTSETRNLHSRDGHLKPQYVRFFLLNYPKTTRTVLYMLLTCVVKTGSAHFFPVYFVVHTFAKDTSNPSHKIKLDTAV